MPERVREANGHAGGRAALPPGTINGIGPRPATPAANKSTGGKNRSVVPAMTSSLWRLQRVFRPPARNVVNVSILHRSPAAILPDSGRAWVMVLVAFTVGFVAFGTMYSFGAFFAPMAAEFQASRAATSAFFSITGLIFYLVGSIAGHLGDRFGPAVMTALGAAIMGCGLVSTGFIGQMWVGYLTYGIGVGVGAACAYVPTLAILGGWFTRKRNAALGTAAAGTGCGMLVVPPLSAALIGHYGWRVTSMILGIGCAVLLALAATLVRRPPLPAASVHRSLSGIVRSFEFLMLYASWVLATIALFVPLVFLPAYVAAHGGNQVAGAALLSLLGGVSVLGRLGIGVFADRIGTARLFKASVLLMAVSYLLWIIAPSYVWLVAFAVALGLGLRPSHRADARSVDRAVRRAKPGGDPWHLLHRLRRFRGPGAAIGRAHRRCDWQLPMGDRLRAGDGNVGLCGRRAAQGSAR